MGLPMAVNLAKTNNVLVFDLSEDARSKAQEQGLTTADSIASVVQQSSTLLTMLPGDSAVHSVLEIFSEHCPANATTTTRTVTVIDCSTVSPSTSRYWHDQLAAQGHVFVDAPVSGGVHGAQNASLTFMVGSSEEGMQSTIAPILKGMGHRVIACGGPGAGAAVKLCNNLALAAQMVGICEAMNLGDALGVDPIVLANVMNTSTAKSWSCEVNNPHPAVASQTNKNSPASKDYAGGFGTKLMLKDLSLAVAAGRDARVALPLGTATKELYQLADLHGLGDKDFGVMLQFLKGKY
jgi:3-hydroxyisobutyrate dehydrogenase